MLLSWIALIASNVFIFLCYFYKAHIDMRSDCTIRGILQNHMLMILCKIIIINRHQKQGKASPHTLQNDMHIGSTTEWCRKPSKTGGTILSYQDTFVWRKITLIVQNWGLIPLAQLFCQICLSDFSSTLSCVN